MKVPPVLERYRSIVDDFDAFVEASSLPLEKTFRVNRVNRKPEAAARWTHAVSSHIERVPWLDDAFVIRGNGSFHFMAGYLAGLFHIQEASSMVPAAVLAPRPGDRVLDLCAAPGNKTAQLAQAVGPTGTVVANDVSRERLGVARTTLDRLSLSNVILTAMDAAELPVDVGLFDAVLADVPCSCEGTSRRHPNVLFRTETGFRERLVTLQERILRRALEACRPGGRVVYATCTYAPEECEGVVTDVLESDAGRGWSLVSARIAGLETDPGLRSFAGRRYHPDMEKTIRIWPHANDTGGFFVALLESDEDRVVRKDPDENETGARAKRRTANSPACVNAFPEALMRQFDLPQDVADRLCVFPGTRRYATVLERTCRPPLAEIIQGVGVRAIGMKGGRLRLSTAGVMLLGAHARSRALDLEDAALRAYLARENVPLRRNQMAATGACIVLSEGLAFGRGERACLDGGGLLLSQYPRVSSGVYVQPSIGEPE